VQIRSEQLEAHLQKNLAGVYTIHGDEPLLALEAADAVRSAARAKGYAEREVLIAERGFDWSELRNATASLSLFGAAKLVELRIPGGKPGTQGAEAIAASVASPNPDTLLLVTLPRLDKAAQNSPWFLALAQAGPVVDVFPLERARLPEWIGARLARQQQRAPRELLDWLADRVEGNLLAAHQEVQKLALLAPPGELGEEVLVESVARVARYTPQDASIALLAGDTVRYLRVLEGLRGEGEALTFVLWVVSEDIRALARIRAGVEAGRPIEQLMRDNRVWGPRQAVFRAAARRFSADALQRATLACAKIDRAIKGAAKDDPWDEFIKLGLALRADPAKSRAARVS
jgi:DNA polymerase-3 subunit delta